MWHRPACLQSLPAIRISKPADERKPSADLEQHIHRGALCPGTVCGIHLAEIPLHPEKDIPAHYERIGVLFIIVSDRVGKIARLVQDVIDTYAQIERSDILGNHRIPAPFRLAVTFGVAVEKGVSQFRVELELMLGSV